MNVEEYFCPLIKGNCRKDCMLLSRGISVSEHDAFYYCALGNCGNKNEV